MNRVVHWLVASLLCVATLANEERACRADDWPGIQQSDPVPVLVSIPAGALPPGPAELSVDPSGDGRPPNTLRFVMPPDGPARLRLRVWNSEINPTESPRVVKVRGRSDSGAMWRARIDAPFEDRVDSPPEPLFLGDGAALSDFARQVHDYATMGEPQGWAASNIRVVSFESALEKGCRWMAGAGLVVAVGGTPQQGGALRDCASRGAHVLLIGSELAGPALPFAAGQSIQWGGGAIAWAPAIDGSAARGALDLRAIAGKPAYAEPFQVIAGLGEGVPSEEGRAGPSRSSILVLLMLYVAVLGPVGYFVNRRSRAPWLAWGWFPSVSLACTLAVVAVVAVSGKNVPTATLQRISVTTPDGVGLEHAFVTIQASLHEVYKVTLPWQDGDIVTSQPFHFGTPFRRPAGPLELHEDAIRGTLRVNGLGATEYGLPALRAVQAFQAPVPHLEWKSDALWLSNPTPNPVAHAEVVVDGAVATLDDVEPSGWRRLELKSSSPLPSAATVPPDSLREQRRQLREMGEAHTRGSRSYFLASETKEPVSAVTTEPALAVVERTTRVVLGPIPASPKATPPVPAPPPPASRGSQ